MVLVCLFVGIGGWSCARLNFEPASLSFEVYCPLTVKHWWSYECAVVVVIDSGTEAGEVLFVISEDSYCAYDLGHAVCASDGGSLVSE